MIARYGSLAIFLFLVVLAAAAGTSFDAGEWYYVNLTRPGWAPPPWLLAPAWAAAYVFAALAAWHIWLTDHYDRVKVLAWWLVLPLLNIAWSYLYFGIHRPGWSWLLGGLTVVLTVVCLWNFRRISKPAANLMIPYLLWIAFNWILNLATWTLNGGFLLRFI